MDIWFIYLGLGPLKFGFVTLMQRDEGIKLVTEAICSGIFNDLGSGSNVDVCVITKVCCLSLVFTIF